MARDVNKVCEGLARNGWYPAQWAHHPEPVRALIRACGFRPQVKQCYMNCQKLVVFNWLHGSPLELEYREGWCQTLIPFEHAWLRYEGKELDLPLDEDNSRKYLKNYSVPVQEIMRYHYKSGIFGVVRQDKLVKISPFYEAIQQLEKFRQAGAIPA